MTRTQKYKAQFSRNIRREEITPGYRLIPFGHNLTKQAYYEKCYNECTEWELQMSQKDVESMDSRAMDKEWKRMQDTVEQETE